MIRPSIWKSAVFNQGLSLDQAPPISVVLRFFLSVPVFGVLFALLLIIHPLEVLTPSHPVSLSAIHLFFLGVISMSMIGSLFQMQSVLGGRPVPSALGNAALIHTLFTIGLVSLASAFLLHIPALFVTAAVLLGSSLVYLVQLILPLLFGGVVHDTLRGMRLALTSLLVTVLLGVIMAVSFANEIFGDFHVAIRTAHFSLALAGWVAALIIAVAFQVIEMFYVTPPYNAWYKRYAFGIIALSLVVKILWLSLTLPYIWMFDLLIAVLLLGFIVTTALQLGERKRRVSDVSIWFWMMGMGLLLVSLLSHLAYLRDWSSPLESMALIAFGLFALAVILGMMSKIVPFLVWFHLNSSGYLETPVMSNIIPAKRNKTLFVVFSITSAVALVSVFMPVLLSIAGVGFLALFALLGYNLIYAVRLYDHIRKTGTRFEMALDTGTI